MTLVRGPDLAEPGLRAGQVPSRPPRRPRRLPEGWLLLGALAGYGLIWVLGLRLFVWPLVAVGLGWWLLRRGTLRVPVGFGLWMCFLWWSAISVLTIRSGERLAAWGYRESLYLSATVILVYLVTVTRRELPTRWLATAILWLFGTSVVLGTLGLVVPDLSVPTVAEAVLPSSLTSSQFIAEQVMARLSATAEFLGAVRPVGPYGYTNEWGAAMGMLWPLAIYSVQWVRSSGWRAVSWGLIGVAIVPAVLSVNRGLWISVVVAVAVVLLRAALVGRAKLAAATATLVGLVFVVVWFSPLRDTLYGRLERPNLGTRQTLAGDALAIVQQSPWFGLGAPQEATIAADTNDVSVGTHGQLFTLLVSHGLPGTFFYLAFLVSALVVTWRVSARAWWAWAALVVLVVQTGFYNGVPVPLVLGFVAYACCLRDMTHNSPTSPLDRHREDKGGHLTVAEIDDVVERPRQTVDVARYGHTVRRRWWLVLGLGLAGAVAGVALLPSASYSSLSSVAVGAGYVDPSSPSSVGGTNMATEQQVAQSSGVVSRAVDALPGSGVDANDFDQRGVVTSPPDSTTLAFAYSSSSQEEARDVVEAWSEAYLAERAEALSDDLATERTRANERVAGLQRDLAVARQRQQALPAGTQRAEAADIAVANVGSQLESARSTVSQLQVLDVDAGRSLGAATEPGSPSGLTPLLAGILGGLAGVLGGAALALLLGRLDRRVGGQSTIAGVDVWSDGTGREPAADNLDGVAARLAMLVRRTDVKTVLLASMTDTDPDLAEPLVESLRTLGVAVTRKDGVEGLLARRRARTPAAGDEDGSKRRTSAPRLTVVTARPVLLDERIVVLGAQADLTLLVVDAAIVSRPDVDRVVAALRRNGASVGGLLISAGPRVSVWGQRLRRRSWISRGGAATTPRVAADEPSV